jgi:hypothetical protein
MTYLTESEQDKVCPWLSQIQPYRHYALMAMNQGSIGHARYMVRKLEKETPELAGLGILTAEKIKVLRNERISD